MSEIEIQRLACFACSKSKVKCDRLPICSRCKRRGNTCKYPQTNARSLNANRNLEKRVKDLEQYVRVLGGDVGRVPNKSENRSIAEDRQITPAPGTTRIFSDDAQDGMSRKSKLTQGSQPAIHSDSLDVRDRPEATLIEQDEQLSYVETPMWYSFSEAKKANQQTSQQVSTPQPLLQLRSQGRSGSAILFGNSFPSNNDSLIEMHPPEDIVLHLWNNYLTNVHPLIKIFFDWEIESLIRTAAKNPKSLSQGEDCLVLAIYLVTIFSLSDQKAETIFGRPKPELLDQFQSGVEASLSKADFTATNECVVLQALVLYLTAMRNRATPKTLSSLLGLAVRIAERMGLHRDGSIFGLPVVRAEERRRLWWQMQYMDISFAQLIGCIPMTVLGDWDTELPANLDDSDVHSRLDSLPSNRSGLTSMSHCLWRYLILHWQRKRKSPDGSKEGWKWVTSTRLSLEEKNSKFDENEREFGRQFLQFCEPLNPLHLLIQIGIRSALLSARRIVLQPRLANIKISEMSRSDRTKLLDICTKHLEYCIMSETDPSIEQFRWFNEHFFPWIPCKLLVIYTVMEAHHQAAESSVTRLWNVINKLCLAYPRLTTVHDRPEIATIQRLILLAWQRREKEVEQQYSSGGALSELERPWCVVELNKRLVFTSGEGLQQGQVVPHSIMDFPLTSLNDTQDLDFGPIDWSFWDTLGGLDL